jgi:hypothetical protein
MNLYYLQWTLKSGFCRPPPFPSKKVPSPSKILDPPLLIIDYKTLVSVTNNFINDVTRLNCSKIKPLITHQLIVRSQIFFSYFLSL